MSFHQFAGCKVKVKTKTGKFIGIAWFTDEFINNKWIAVSISLDNRFDGSKHHIDIKEVKSIVKV